MPQRVAVIFEYPSLNGGENSMLQAMKATDPSVFELIAIAPAEGRLAAALGEQSIEHLPFTTHDEAGRRLPRLAIKKQLVQTLNELTPDLVHANSLSMGRLTGSIQHALVAPCTTHIRDILKLSGAAVQDINANRCIIAVSQATRDFHVAQGFDAARTCVVYNAVDCERFQLRPATGSLLRELNLPESSFIILTIGQIGLRKAQDVLAEAAPRMAARVADVHFVVVGQRNSGKAESVAFERNLSLRFEQAGLAERFHAIGYRDDVDRLLNEADLLVHTAKQEPLGRVLLEAAASGVAMVATDVGGTAEILTDGVSGRLIPPGDADRLANAVIELAENQAIRRQFGIAARQRAEQQFNATKVGARLSEVWQHTLHEATPRGE